MATFKVGQRVRILPGRYQLGESDPAGKEGTVVNPLEECLGKRVAVEVDGDCEWLFLPHVLVPLTDPKADAFLESIRKLKPLHEEPKAPVRTITVRFGTK